MASGKETPRQKMIGMMYLVLLAMLALNISKDALEAFVVVNEGLEETVQNFTSKNEQLYTEFKKQYALDSSKVGEFWEQAKTVKGQSGDLIGSIENLKNHLIAETEGISMEVADTMNLMDLNQKDNYDVPTHIMIGAKEDGSAGKAFELKNEIAGYRDELRELLGEENFQALNLGLETRGAFVNGVNYNWELYNFHNTPLSASIAILSRVQNEVKNAEYDAVNFLYQQIGQKDLPFDKVVARVIAPKTYLFTGEDYQADIFLAAYSSTKNPKVLIENENGELEEIDVEKGLGKMNVRTDEPGLHSYKGQIVLQDNSGLEQSFPFESEYLVAPPALTVSAKKMNAMYIGLDNPVSISVPGVASENIIARINGSNRLRPGRDGEYIAKIDQGTPRTIEIRVYARMENGEEKFMGVEKFRAKNLPKPFFEYAGKTADCRVRAGTVRANLAAKVDYDPSFLFQDKPNVVSYTVRVIRGSRIGTPITVRGKHFPQGLKEIIDAIRPGDKILFGNIKGKGPDNITHSIPGFQIEVF